MAAVRMLAFAVSCLAVSARLGGIPMKSVQGFYNADVSTPQTVEESSLNNSTQAQTGPSGFSGANLDAHLNSSEYKIQKNPHYLAAYFEGKAPETTFNTTTTTTEPLTKTLDLKPQTDSKPGDGKSKSPASSESNEVSGVSSEESSSAHIAKHIIKLSTLLTSLNTQIGEIQQKYDTISTQQRLQNITAALKSGSLELASTAHTAAALTAQIASLSQAREQARSKMLSLQTNIALLEATHAKLSAQLGKCAPAECIGVEEARAEAAAALNAILEQVNGAAAATSNANTEGSGEELAVNTQDTDTDKTGTEPEDEKSAEPEAQSEAEAAGSESEATSDPSADALRSELVAARATLRAIGQAGAIAARKAHDKAMEQGIAKAKAGILKKQAEDK